MTDNALPCKLSIPVTVFIGAINRATQVRYTYTDPGDPPNPHNAPVFGSESCILNAVAPYATVFTLDNASQRDGWILIGAIPNEGNIVPPYSMTTTPTSLTTYDDGEFRDYRFYLSFYNPHTGQWHQDDPQESNVPKTKPSGNDSF